MLKSIGWMSLSTVLRMGSGFVLFVIVARQLGVESFGTLSYWMAVAGLATLPVNYGFGLYALREIGRNPAISSALIADTLVAKLALAALMAMVFALSLPWLAERQTIVAWALLAMFFLESFAEHFNAGLRASGAFHVEAKLAVLISFGQLGLVSGVALIAPQLESVALAFFASRFFALLLTCLVYRRGKRLAQADWRGACHRIAQTLRAGLPYAADTVVSTINSTVDVLILQHFAGARAVGQYQAGMRLMQGANAVAPILGNVYIPRISNEYRAGNELDTVLSNLMFKLLISAGLIGAGFAWLGEPLIHLLFGSSYSEVGHLMPWFGLLLLIRHLATSFGVNLTAAGLQKSRVFINVCSLLGLCLTAFALTPKLGAQGLVLALNFAALIVAGAYASIVLKRGLPTGFNRTNGAIFVFSLALIAPRCLATYQS
ncbi:oligosaccharide flippase family protein [Roseateles sp. PN1]|uniref:oligosaccharide flippase family protein n=1 Tax=Roseateles sp. PN1 TaxID=3137372 RepID=UPI0031395E17